MYIKHGSIINNVNKQPRWRLEQQFACKRGTQSALYIEILRLIILELFLKTQQNHLLQFPFCIRLGCTCQCLTIQNLSFLDELEGLFFKLFGELLAVPLPQLVLE